MRERLRVIIALADAFEGAAVYDELLSDGFEPVWRSSVRDAADEMRAQPFDLLIADMSFALSGDFQSEGRARNPRTPIILIGDAGSQHVSLSGRVMYLTRPVDRAMLTCFVTMALLQEKPVRRSVRKLVDRIQAIANGVPSHIVDVSAEGLRLEMPADHGSVLPPLFSVRVPTAGITLIAQRKWTQSASNRGSAIWYGGALSQNRTSVEQGWRLFVDAIPVVGQSSATPSESAANAFAESSAHRRD